MYSSSTPLTIGVFLAGDAVQMGDIVPVDVLGMLSTEYMAVLPPSAAPLKALATPMTIVYIHDEGVSPFSLTAGAKLAVTHSTKNAPKLDILVVPGPPPGYQATEAEKAFINSTHASGTSILAICTGIFPVAASGVLDGKVATGPLGVLPMLRNFFPAVEWTGDRRWEKAEASANGGEVWTSGGVFHGLDLVSAFIGENFAKEAVEAMLALAGVSARPVEYSEAEKKQELMFASGAA